MSNALIISLILFVVSITALIGGIFILRSKYKSHVKILFFAITVAIAIWSSGMALSTIASDAAIAEIYRRFSAIGWSVFYAILLHFILIITGKYSLLKKWWLYLCLYSPLFLSLFAFAIPNGLNPNPYILQQTEYGWINIAQHNVWNWIIYFYSISFLLIGLFFLYRWWKESSVNTTKKQAIIIFWSLVVSMSFVMIIDIVLNSMFYEILYLAPVIILIPLIILYRVLQKNEFGIVYFIDNKRTFIMIFIHIFLYIGFSTLKIILFNKNIGIETIYFDKTIIAIAIAQIKTLLLLYLALRKDRLGYIVAVTMDIISLLLTGADLIRSCSIVSFVEVITYLGFLLVIIIVRKNKDEKEAYIKKIEDQAVKEKFYSNLFNQVPIGIAVMRKEGSITNKEFRYTHINPMYAQILGRTKEELGNSSWLEVTDPRDVDAELEYHEQFITNRINQYSMEKRAVKLDGSIVWVDKLASRFDSLTEYVSIILDITERKETEAKLKYSNEHDMLTGVCNYAMLKDTLKEDALIAFQNKRALLCINLFNMYALDLRYGLHYTQTVLKQIADSLNGTCDENFKLFTTSNYQFIFYVRSYEEKKELLDCCNKISGILHSHLDIHGINAGIGVLQMDQLKVNDTGELLKTLMNTSDIATQNINNSNILFYNSELETLICRENDIVREITEIINGIESDRFYLQFQPIFDIVSNQICEFEALARLNNAKYGLVSPLEFIAIAEKTNQILKLGEIIIFQALSFLKELKKNGRDEIIVTINISPLQILKTGFTKRLLEMINERNLNPENIGIELTESTVATNEAEIKSIIKALKAAGIKILIDDFGTGYSSFSRTRQLNADYLKIDKSFIDKLMVLKSEEAITGDIITMGHKMNYIVVAEGVEHEKQFNYLRDNGCERIQGYLISKPLDKNVALDFEYFCL